MSAALFAAIDDGDIERVKGLLAADPAMAASVDDEDVSPLLFALYRNQREIATLLRELAPPRDACTAAAVGDVDRLAALLDADPGLATALAGDGFTALQIAAFFGQLESARLLLDRGADPSATARNPMRISALHAATATRQDAIVELLLAAGADVNARQQGGWTPLMAAAQNGDAETVDCLVAAGADPWLVNDAGESAADLAERAGHANVVDRLVRAGVG
jgi:adenosylhomocysteine nucleosidase